MFMLTNSFVFGFLFISAIIILRLIELVFYIPYFIFVPFGKGDAFKRKHYILVENIHQFMLQPKRYLKRRKSIHRQIVENSKTVLEKEMKE